MRLLKVSCLLVSLGSLAVAQSSPGYVAPGIPVGTPIPGNYTGDLRPQLHFSPPQHFMNDPNGMFVDNNGTYHLYYQYNPLTNVAGNQHWGHATTQDLYTWINQPIAVFPPNNDSDVFSGSAIVDVNNTSGFFPNQTNGVIAMYTLYTASSGLQDQWISYSYDGGYSFESYSGNPVININSTQFRDPKVIWHAPTQKWVVVLSYADYYTVGIYTSPNMKDWTFASNFSHAGLLGQQYECPNLVEMPMEGSDETMWLLGLSINPGAPLGGSISQYFPGQFNGTHFVAVDNAARISDWAKDNYAGQFFYGIPGDQPQISIAWASNWEYTNLVPTGNLEGWRSVMSVPRYNYLTNITMLGYDLISTPVNISSQYTMPLASNSSIGNNTIVLDYSGVKSGALYFEANITGLPSKNLAGTVNMTFTSSQSGESVRLGTYIGGATFLSRADINGFDNIFFTDKFSVYGEYNTSAAEWSISGIIDRSIIEVFVNGGEESATMVFYPTSPLDEMSLGAASIPPGASVSIAVWALEDAWAKYENGSGTVVGNVTNGGGGGGSSSMMSSSMMSSSMMSSSMMSSSMMSSGMPSGYGGGSMMSSSTTAVGPSSNTPSGGYGGGSGSTMSSSMPSGYGGGGSMMSSMTPTTMMTSMSGMSSSCPCTVSPSGYGPSSSASSVAT